MNQYKLFRFMEVFWLIMAVVFFLISAWFLTATRWDEAKFPLFCTFCASILYGLRRYQRIKMEKAGKNSSSEK